jgi:6-phosphogluconolactonase
MIRMEGERPDHDQAARDYQPHLLRGVDLLLLGVGDDGHVASLFPGSPLLDEKTRTVVAVSNSPKPPPHRITITPRVIAEARAILVLVTGKNKADAVARALEGPLDPKKTPAQLARSGAWVLDRAAASLLRNT